MPDQHGFEWKAGIILPMLYFVHDLNMWNRLGIVLETLFPETGDQVEAARTAIAIYPALFSYVRSNRV